MIKIIMIDLKEEIKKKLEEKKKEFDINYQKYLKRKKYKKNYVLKKNFVILLDGVIYQKFIDRAHRLRHFNTIKFQKLSENKKVEFATLKS